MSGCADQRTWVQSPWLQFFSSSGTGQEVLGESHYQLLRMVQEMHLLIMLFQLRKVFQGFSNTCLLGDEAVLWTKSGEVDSQPQDQCQLQFWLEKLRVRGEPQKEVLVGKNWGFWPLRPSNLGHRVLSIQRGQALRTTLLQNWRMCKERQVTGQHGMDYHGSMPWQENSVEVRSLG